MKPLSDSNIKYRQLIKREIFWALFSDISVENYAIAMNK